jgi:hypothetical protein
MKLLVIVGLGVCLYYVIDVASKWQQRNEVQKGIWFAFIAICAGWCFFCFFHEVADGKLDCHQAT